MAGGILAVIAYILRMISRLPTFGGQLGWDDALMTFAILEVIPLTVFSVICKEIPYPRAFTLADCLDSGQSWTRQGHLENTLREHHGDSEGLLLR